MRWFALGLFGLAAAAAPAAERKLFVSSFERLRVDGPFRVVVTTGRSPAGRVAGDPRQLDAMDVKQEGGTIYVRRSAARRDEQPREAVTQPVVVTLATPSLSAAYLVGAGEVVVAGLKGTRVDLSVAGTGTIAVAATQANELNATVIGSGRIAVAGRATRARLLVNGAGRVDAGKLQTDEVTARLDGPGEIAAAARYTATLVNTGLGRIALAGPAKCSIKAQGGGPVTCGAGQAR